MSTPVQQSEAPATFERRLFSAEDFHRMLDASILKPGERVQLLRGEVVMVDDQTPRLFTVEEYRRMAEAGILAPDERVELIAGEIVEMSPIGSRHLGYVLRLQELLGDLLEKRAHISIQSPVHLGGSSEPEPDIAILRRRADFYTDSLPEPGDVLLLIEVSDSTLPQDRAVKVPLYARSGIVEVWILNLQEELIEVYSEPSSQGYGSVRLVKAGESLRLPGFPDLLLRVGDLFS